MGWDVVPVAIHGKTYLRYQRGEWGLGIASMRFPDHGHTVLQEHMRCSLERNDGTCAVEMESEIKCTRTHLILFIMHSLNGKLSAVYTCFVFGACII